MSKIIKRSDVDDVGRRNINKNSFKNRMFDGKRSMEDAYTKEKIFYASHDHFTPNTTANIDHIETIDGLIKEYGKDVSKEELKRVLNSDYNLAVTSEALNKAKSSQSNHEYLLQQIKKGHPKDLKTSYNMLSKELSAKMAIKTEINTMKVTKFVSKGKIISSKTATQLGNSVGSAMGRGVDAALIALPVSTLTNIVMVVSGKKDVETALKDIAIDTRNVGVTQAGISIAQDLMLKIVSQPKSQKVIEALGSKLPIAEISMLAMVATSTFKYLNGEVSAEDCGLEILLNGAGNFAFGLGMTTGNIAIAVALSAVVSQISETILKYQQEVKINAAREAALNRLVFNAMMELEKQRKALTRKIDEENKKYTEAFNNGFELIYLSIINNDDVGVTQGLNCILSVMNKKCKFSTQKEFDEFFDNPNAVLIM